MKKKGFTLIELAVTFSLVTVITILLFEIIISLREIYIKGDLQTTMLSKQGILTKKISNDLEKLKLKKYSSCGEHCITFEYQTGDSYNLSIDLEKRIIRYHDYSWQLPTGATLGTIHIDTYKGTNASTTVNDSLLKLEIPVEHKLLEREYGISIIYQYSSAILPIPPSNSEPPVTPNQ